jgi:2-polyprenyl-6-methoxyphenol hydroxylase-like FAD-dependent oxidoreductase
MKVVINGAGIAGPTLAYWLQRSGHDVVMVELAPELRTGGYIIDFWGIGYDIAEKIGIIPQIRDLGYQIEEVRFVGPHGRKKAGFSVDVFSRLTHDRFTSLKRSDLSAAIFESLGPSVETIFGDSIARIEDRGSTVHVEFEHAPAREFDLVIGAGGLHSRVRKLVFGPEDEFIVPLGYHVAAFEVDGYKYRDELVYVSRSLPGKQISRFSMRDNKSLFLFIFRDELLKQEAPKNLDEIKRVIVDVFGDVEWEWPEIRAAMKDVDDIYYDQVSQTRMTRWTKGRTALIGDAAACISLLGGEGTGLAMAEAYVLAGELHNSRGDHTAAFARFENRLRPFLEKKQAGARKLASSFAPQTAIGIAIRDFIVNLLRIPFIANYFIGRDLRDDIRLPNYDFV